jgi:hypothetical protein
MVICFPGYKTVPKHHFLLRLVLQQLQLSVADAETASLLRKRLRPYIYILVSTDVIGITVVYFLLF